MALPWQTLDRVDTPDGPLELRQRGERDFLITIRGRVLMNSHANRSEVALAQLACRALGKAAAPRVLIGGLGMGCTLRAALDALPGDARVIVCELNPVVVAWCQGPLAPASRDALSDGRVEIDVGDVTERIRREAREARLDAIILDLYEGPHAGTDPVADPIYGQQALALMHRSLAPGGVLAIWSEGPDHDFERRLGRAGFVVERKRPGRGGRRHAVYLATRPG